MIEKEIISSLIRNSEKQAISITLKYGLAETIKTVASSSAKNYYYYLVKGIDKSFKIFVIFILKTMKDVQNIYSQFQRN